MAKLLYMQMTLRCTKSSNLLMTTFYFRMMSMPYLNGLWPTFLPWTSSNAVIYLFQGKGSPLFQPANLELVVILWTRSTSLNILELVSLLIWSKTRKLIGVFYRKFYLHSEPVTLLRLYKSLMWPHLEYGPSVWDPHLKTEGHRLTGWCACLKQWNCSYDDLIGQADIQH